MDEELKLLLALQVQALGQEAFEAIAQGLDGIVEHAGAVAPAVALAGAALAGLAGAAVGIGAAVDAAAQWQTTLTQVANNTNMSDAAMSQMNDTILAMAQTTSAPLQQLADGYMHVANMGFQGADATNVLQAAMESAVSTGGDTADVANVLANVMHEFGMQAGQASQAMDVLHTAAALGNMTLEQMTNSFGPVAAIASTIGVPLDQASAAMAAITRHGFDAAEAGTQLKNMLEKIAAPTAGAEQEMAKLAATTGVDLTQDFSQAGLATKGLTGVLDDIARATNGNVDAFSQLTGGAKLTTDQMNQLAQASHGNIQAIQQLDPNIRGLYAMFILTGRGAGDYLDILKQIDASTQGAGITAESYARTQATLGFQIGVLKNNLQVAAIELGDHFMPQITAAVEWITGSAIPGIMALADWVGGALTPAVSALGETWQRVTAAFQGGGLIAGLESLLGDIASFIGSMFQAGWNLVATFAQGMMQAADSLITAVINDIASLIGSFFIGNSPPPAGPLSKIDQGGKNTMQAYIEGMQQQLTAGGLADIATQIGHQFDGMQMAANFAPLAAQVQATTQQVAALNDQAAGAAGNVKRLQGAMQGETAQITDALNGINAQLQTNGDQQTVLKGVISDITDSYNAQIDPLQQQLDLLKSQVDYAQQLRDANESVQMAQLDQSILSDQGDPTKVAGLQAQLQSLQEQQKGLDLQSQIANLEAQKKQAAGNPAKLAALALQQQELQVQQQIYDLTNHTQLAADQAAKAKLAAMQAQQAAAEKVAAAQKAAAEAKLAQDIAGIKAKEDAALKPYQAQLKALTDQSAVLNTQKQQWTDLQGQIKAATQQAQSLTSALGAAKGLAAGLGGVKLPGVGGSGVGGAGIPGLPSAADVKSAMDTAMQAAVASAQQKAQEAAKQWIASFAAQLKAAAANLAGQLPDLGARLTDWLGGQWAKIDWRAVWGRATGLAAGLGTALAAVDWGKAGTDLGTGLGKALGLAMAAITAGGKVASELLAALGSLFGQVDWGAVAAAFLPKMMDFLFGLFDAAFNPSVLGPILQKHWFDILQVGLMFVGGEALLPAKLLAPIAEALSKIPLAGPIIKWVMLGLNDAAAPLRKGIGEFFGDVFGQIAKAFTDVVFPDVETGLKGIGTLVGDFKDTLYLQALELADKIGEAFANAGPRQIADAVRGVIKIIDDALVAFVQVIIDLGGNLVRGLWKGIEDMGGWFVTNVVTWLDTWLLRPVLTFFGIAGPSTVMATIGNQIVQGLMQGIAALAQSLLQTVQDTVKGLPGAVTAFLPNFVDAGHQLIEGLKQGILSAAADVANAAKGVVQAAIDTAKSALGIHSPSAVFAEIGRQSVAGFVQGLQLNQPLAVQASAMLAGGAAGGARAFPGSGGGSGTIVVNVTGNTILNDQDAARLATIIGRHLVQQTGAAYSLAGLGGR